MQKILVEGVGDLYADLGLESGCPLCNQNHCATLRPFRTPHQLDDAPTNVEENMLNRKLLIGS